MLVQNDSMKKTMALPAEGSCFVWVVRGKTYFLSKAMNAEVYRALPMVSASLSLSGLDSVLLSANVGGDSQNVEEVLA